MGYAKASGINVSSRSQIVSVSALLTGIQTLSHAAVSDFRPTGGPGRSKFTMLTVEMDGLPHRFEQSSDEQPQNSR
jgi:hypothetical protein